MSGSFFSQLGPLEIGTKVLKVNEDLESGKVVLLPDELEAFNRFKDMEPTELISFGRRAKPGPNLDFMLEAAGAYYDFKASIELENISLLKEGGDIEHCMLQFEIEDLISPQINYAQL